MQRINRRKVVITRVYFDMKKGNNRTRQIVKILESMNLPIWYVGVEWET